MEIKHIFVVVFIYTTFIIINISVVLSPFDFTENSQNPLFFLVIPPLNPGCLSIIYPGS